jgi:hypothetical protein
MAKKRKSKAKKTSRQKPAGKEFAFVDAEKPLTLHVTQADIDGAVPRSSRNCVLSRTVRREHKCFDIVVFRTVAYVRKSESSVPLRYQVTESAKDLLVTFDASGRSHPITITFTPPRHAISKEHLQSARRKQAAKRSYEKRKQREQRSGVRTRRAYTLPDPLTLLGVRNGSGWRPPGRGGRLRTVEP